MRDWKCIVFLNKRYVSIWYSNVSICNIKTKVKKIQISLFIVLKNSSLLHFHSRKSYTLIPLHVPHHVAAMLLHKIHTTLLWASLPEPNLKTKVMRHLKPSSWTSFHLKNVMKTALPNNTTFSYENST